ncbi:hypothetical protein OSB04_010917 [Centaurea solstitialis]|uniref:Uncharacterized protein n=1 Tax=Centaurea solstitialis TaxID=347529 RepID=A0AA38T8G5_9ASTR|nr:hypothetical protein OSB04_010917 [Centaurea solstitialis]
MEARCDDYGGDSRECHNKLTERKGEKLGDFKRSFARGESFKLVAICKFGLRVRVSLISKAIGDLWITNSALEVKTCFAFMYDNYRIKETYSPVVDATTSRYLISLVIQE